MDTSASRQKLLQRLESLQSAGVQTLPKGRPHPAEPHAATATPATTENTEIEAREHPMPARTKQQAMPIEASPGEVISQATTLEILQTEVAGCTLCDELATTRTQTVFGVGNPKAQLVFLGEAPGADEDRTGIPFVGRAGQLLTKIIEACTLSRDDVYILNVLKCRPPGNRNPSPTESANCKRYLRRQLELIDPEFICCLGAVAAQNLLETTETIGKLRGRFHTYRGIRVACTYHPAYLLRNPSAKKDTWEDMKMLMRELGIDL